MHKFSSGHTRWLLPLLVAVTAGCTAVGQPPVTVKQTATIPAAKPAEVAAEQPVEAPVQAATAVMPAQPAVNLAGVPQNGHWAHAFNPLVPLAQSMLTQMEFNNQEVSGATRIAVSSFVDLNSLTKTDTLGRQLAETFSHELHQRGFTVVDYKVTGTIRVTQNGDFAMSRNLDDLSKNHVVEYVLAGTISQQYNGMVINARLVNLSSKMIAASAQGFIPAQQMRDMMKNSRMFRVQEGMLIRDNTLSLRPISLR